MVITWLGTLVIFLNKMFRKLFKEEELKTSVEDRNKRIGIYFMCIDDLFS